MITVGKMKDVTSPSNPLVKGIKALSLKKNRDREGVFLAEGQKLVADALESGWDVKTLVYAKSLLDDEHQRPRVENLAATVRARGGDILTVNEKILSSITRRDNPQMVVAVIGQRTRQAEEIAPEANHVWIALDRVRDPGNLGTIIRTADALGAKGIILVGETTDPFGLEAVRATMGSLFHVPLIQASVPQFQSLAMRWRDVHNGQVVGTHLKGAVDHRSIDYSCGPQLLLMGNEQQGLGDDLVRCCDQLALIAMSGSADSLNLAVATGIMVFEARRHAL